MLMSEVSSAVASCKPPLNCAHSFPLYLRLLFCRLLTSFTPSSAPRAHFISPVFSTFERPFVLPSFSFLEVSAEVTSLCGTTVFLTLIWIMVLRQSFLLLGSSPP